MRYLHWDVLVFAEQSRVPLQEFRTACHVTYDPDSIGTLDPGASNLTANPVAQRQSPIVTCFMPSLQHGCPFRVSLHSWQEPEASRGTQSLTLPNDKVFFEARVLLDGVCAGPGRDIKVVAEMDKTGNQECLRFPPFHQQMLAQKWWTPEEDMGRIKLVISEGIAPGQGPSSVFRRVRSLVTFSFQHAPLAILEEAGIAWPNAGMWTQMTQPLYAPRSPYEVGVVDVGAHAHSPRRRSIEAPAASVAPGMLMNNSMPPPARRAVMLNDCSWAPNPPPQDPFIDKHRHQAPREWGTRVSTSDDSMPDYSHSITPRSSRDHSLHELQGTHGGSYLQPDSQFEELISSLSPANPNGTQAPPTTRVSSASNSPPTAHRAIGGAHSRAGPLLGQAPRSVSITTREAPGPGPGPVRTGREISDVSMKSRFSDRSSVSEAQAAEGEHSHSRVERTPAVEVKSRKEGRSSDSDLLGPPSRQTGTVRRRQKSATKEGEEMSASTGEAKRKREGAGSISNLVSEASEGAGSSPSRKISKTKSKDNLGDTARAPLSLLENVQ
ncbi:MAG: hypothetical protein Q9168_000433 [Polycauliona sp. 1 TL-2023]